MGKPNGSKNSSSSDAANIASMLGDILNNNTNNFPSAQSSFTLFKKPAEKESTQNSISHDSVLSKEASIAFKNNFRNSLGTGEKIAMAFGH